MGDLRLPKNLPQGAKGFIKRVPMKILEHVAMEVNTSPDQAVGTSSLLKILRTVRAWLYLTTTTTGIEAFKSMGIEFFTDMEALLHRAKELSSHAEVTVLPQAGASFIAWE